MNFLDALRQQKDKEEGKVNPNLNKAATTFKDFMSSTFERISKTEVKAKDWFSLALPIGSPLSALTNKNPFVRAKQSGTAINLGREILQGTARSVGSFGLVLNNEFLAPAGLSKKIDRIKAPDLVNPTFVDAFQSTLFGSDADILSFEARFESGAKQGQEMLGPTGKYISPFVVGGFAALDLTGLGGPSRKVGQEILEAIAKSRKTPEILGLLDDFVRKGNLNKSFLGDEAKLAETLKNVDNLDDVKFTIDNQIEKSYKKIHGWEDDPYILKKINLGGEEVKVANKLNNGNYVITSGDKVKGIVKADDIGSLFTKGDAPLNDVAKNFKSADEFVKAQGEQVFRGGKNSFDKTLIGEDGVFVTPSKFMAGTFGKNVDELYISPSAKVLSYNDLPKSIKDITNWDDYSKAVSKFGKENGVDVIDSLPTNIDYPRGMERTVLNPDVLKTKSQLEQIWKQSQKSNVIQSAEDYSAELAKQAERGKPYKFADSEFTTVKERGFITTMKESPKTTPEVARKLASNYNPLKDVEALAEAKRLIAQDADEALRFAGGTGEFANTAPTKISNAVASLLIEAKMAAGQVEEAIQLIEKVAERATNAGQAVQALSLWNKLTPEGFVKWVGKMEKNFNKGKNSKKHVNFSAEEKADIYNEYRKILQMEDGPDKAFATAEIQTKIMDAFPSTFSKKLATYQTIAQLLNFKTAIRNIVGNTGFAVLENVKDIPAAALDSALSLFTKVRGKTLPSFNAQASGFKTGLKEGIRDALHGVDTSGVLSKFEVPNTKVFKDGTVGGFVEKLLNIELRVPDRAMYQSAYDGSLYQSIKAHFKTTGELLDEPTDAMKEVAHHEGLYRTFQDESALAAVFSNLKATLNIIGVGEGKAFGMGKTREFGLGDFVLKYPKTPANLLNRGLAYSPAGFLNALFIATKPLLGKTKYSADVQRQFVDSFSRALTGTAGLVGAGALLHRLNIITGGRADDTDIALNQEQAGLGAYKINVDGMKRFVLSGFNPESSKLKGGDTLLSYDWFQPLALPVTVGASVDQTKGNIMGDYDTIAAISESIGAGINQLGDQPLVQNFTKLFRKEKLSDIGLEIIKGIPSSLVPTFLSQVKQLVDNTGRNTYDPNIVKEAFNRAKNRVPFLSETMPPRITTLGDRREVYQDGSNNFFNVVFNPAFKTVYKETPENKLVLDLYAQTGETSQAPRYVQKSMTVNGERVKIGPVTQTQLQTFVGTATKSQFHALALDPRFQSLSDTDKIKQMSNIMTDIGAAAKILILGEVPKKKPSKRTEFYMYQYMTNPDFQQSLESFNEYRD